MSTTELHKFCGNKVDPFSDKDPRVTRSIYDKRGILTCSDLFLVHQICMHTVRIQYTHIEIEHVRARHHKNTSITLIFRGLFSMTPAARGRTEVMAR